MLAEFYSRFVYGYGQRDPDLGLEDVCLLLFYPSIMLVMLV